MTRTHVLTVDEFYDVHGVVFITKRRPGERRVHWYPERLTNGRVERLCKDENASGSGGGGGRAVWLGASAALERHGWPTQHAAAEALMDHTDDLPALAPGMGAST